MVALCATAKKISSSKAEHQQDKAVKTNWTKKVLLCTRATSRDLTLMRESSRLSRKASQRSRDGCGIHTPNFSYHCNTTQENLTKRDN